MYAAITGAGVVTNIIVIPEGDDPSTFGAIACDDGVGIGWFHDGPTFTDPTPPPTLTDLKSEKLADLANIRWEHETGGITVGGADIQTDRDSQALINGAYALANRHIADSGFTIDFKGADGWVSLTASEMIAISDAVGTHVQACFKRERALAALIEAATDVEALEAVNLETGWP